MSNAEGQPRGRGRPATGETPKRYFRADDELWSAIGAAAQAQNKTTSEYIRSVLEMSVRRVLKRASRQ